LINEREGEVVLDNKLEEEVAITLLVCLLGFGLLEV
jgi:hypothetical protein